jgi:hypothetical protein
MRDSQESLLSDPPDLLRAFIRRGRITALPAKRARRRLLLDQVSQAFEPGRTYPEAAVNEILKQVFDDHFVHLGSRRMCASPAGLYWRAGGTVS